MKSVLSVVLLMVFSSSLFTSADAEPITKEIGIAINDAFIPENLTQGNDGKVVINGLLGNSCYSWSRSIVKSPEPYYHEIRAMALLTTKMMCLTVLTSYSKEVNLGSLQRGEHTLRFMNGDDTYFERKFTVQ